MIKYLFEAKRGAIRSHNFAHMEMHQKSKKSHKILLNDIFGRNSKKRKCHFFKSNYLGIEIIEDLQ